VVHDGGLYCFVLASPKRSDLERDGRYALHTFPAESSDDEGYLTGRAIRVTERSLVSKLAAEMRAEARVDWRLYEFTIEVAMAVRRGSVSEYDIWRDPGVWQSHSGGRLGTVGPRSRV